MTQDAASHRSIRIGIFGHYGNGNLGDEAIIEAAIASCRRIGRDRDVEIELFSINPTDSRQRYKLPAHPIRIPKEERHTPRSSSVEGEVAPVASGPHRSSLRERLKRFKPLVSAVRLSRSVLGAPMALVQEIRFLRRSATRVRRIDVMVFAGSNQFLDNFGGVLGFPYTLFKWAWLCRSRGAEVVFFSIGAGPLSHAVSRLMIRSAIRKSAYHSYRDPTSMRLVEGDDGDLGGVVVADLARNLDFDSRVRMPCVTDRRGIVVGINPMPVYDDRYWFVGDATRYSSYVQKMASLTHRLVERGGEVFFFPTHPSDERVIDDVLAVLRDRHRTTWETCRRKSPRSVQELMSVIDEADVVIPTRFHGVVLSLAAERLVFGICYQQKSADVLSAAGQEDYHVMLDRLDVNDAVSRFERLWSRRDLERAKIRCANDRARKELDAQYDLLGSLLAARA